MILDALIARESLGLLREAGLGDLLDALEEPRSYTHRGRINVRAVARHMNCQFDVAASKLQQARSLLGEEK